MPDLCASHGSDHGLSSPIGGSARLPQYAPSVMRNVLLACCCLIAPFGLTACGGGSTSTDQVPTAPPVAQPLADADTLASGSTGGTTTDQTTTAAPSSQTTTGQATTPAVTPSGGAAAPTQTPATTTPATGNGTGGTTVTPQSSGGAAAPAGVVAPSANAGSTKQFCTDNPGAC